MKTFDIEELLVNISLLNNQLFVGIIFISLISDYGEWILSRGKISDNENHTNFVTQIQSHEFLKQEQVHQLLPS